MTTTMMTVDKIRQNWYNNNTLNAKISSIERSLEESMDDMNCTENTKP